ncbi:tubulin--tyrosine ligase-like protein 12 [Cylas formicarius]|uniref:tubulin--tyrosine ligase-like protein 12 n=1 Tax=Cylas formicarius TaxID=197179 RepID=UPI002958936D|nr:tubulin--tyrosine ligase-like protein 12 [Cylas formicarius]
MSAVESLVSKHKDQLLSSGVPQQFWESLFDKLISQTFDAGNSLQLVQFDYNTERQPYESLWGLQALQDICKDHPHNIFIIDHAWTYTISQAKSQLKQFPKLRHRLCAMLGIDMNLPMDQSAEAIYENMWKINNSYSVRSTDGADHMPVWYIMDEIGCAIQHSDLPNCRIAPFVYLPEGITFSLLFPCKNIKKGELIYRDYSEGITDEIARKAALLPWIYTSFENINAKPDIPNALYYLSGHVQEYLPDLDRSNINLTKKDKYMVFSEYSLIKTFLTDTKFEVTEDETEADILWYIKHFRDFKSLSEKPQFINQFPYEYIITVKDLLCMTCRKYKNNIETAPWFPITYNLCSEIGNFVRYFEEREKEGLDNYWIVKPYNLARGMDINITNNLNQIMRLPSTGPKIAQKYIINPVLFYRDDCEGQVKFDLRYVVLLKRVKPLQVYVYKNLFLRFANKPYGLNDLDDYEKHFTVMNYRENAELKHMTCEKFKLEWEKQYKNHPWTTIEKKILKMIRELMECATASPPPCGIAENPQSRALYAADLILDWVGTEMQPKILEMNFMPDCERACNYYPDFYNNIFTLLFTDEDCNDIFFHL